MKYYLKFFNLSDCAASLIRDAIIFGKFRLGEPLSEIKICDKFNLRASLKTLFQLKRLENLLYYGIVVKCNK